MEYNVRLETSAGNYPLAVVRRRARAQELSRIVPDACGLVWKFLSSQQIKGGRHVAVYLDAQITLEVGVEVDIPFAGSDEVIRSSLPGGTAATTVHFGPYQQLHRAHQAIRDWCTHHGHALAGPSWEVYGHWLEAWNRDPSQIRTDLFHLLAPGQ